MGEFFTWGCYKLLAVVLLNCFFAFSAIAWVRLATVEELMKYRGKAHTVVVTDTERGGKFKMVNKPIQVDSGLVFPSVMTSKSWKRVSKSRFVDPKWYGCKANGNDDDTEQLKSIFKQQRCIDLGEAYRTYLISDSISVYSGTIVKGRAKIIQTEDQRAIFAIFNQKRLRFTGLTLVGKGDDSYGQPSFWARGISMVCSSDIHVIGCNLNNFTSGAVYSFLSKHLLIANNRISFQHIKNSNASVCGVAFDHAEYVFIRNNNISGTGQGIVLGANSGRAIIHDNQISDITHEHGMYLDAGLESVIVMHNSVTRTGPQGMGIKIQTNDIWTTRNGKDNVIAYNQISYIGTSGIAIVNTTSNAKNLQVNTVIKGNIISHTNEDGINCSHGLNTQILENQLTDIGRDGISIRNSEHTLLRGNKVNGSGHNGILVNSNEKKAVIEMNDIINSGLKNNAHHRFGIYVSDASDSLVIHSNLLRADNNSMEYGIFIVPKINNLKISDNQIDRATKAGIRFYNKDAPNASVARNKVINCPLELVNCPQIIVSNTKIRTPKLSPTYSSKEVKRLGKKYLKSKG